MLSTMACKDRRRFAILIPHSALSSHKPLVALGHSFIRVPPTPYTHTPTILLFSPPWIWMNRKFSSFSDSDLQTFPEVHFSSSLSNLDIHLWYFITHFDNYSKTPHPLSQLTICSIAMQNTLYFLLAVIRRCSILTTLSPNFVLLAALETDKVFACTVVCISTC